MGKVYRQEHGAATILSAIEEKNVWRHAEKLAIYIRHGRLFFKRNA